MLLFKMRTNERGEKMSDTKKEVKLARCPFCGDIPIEEVDCIECQNIHCLVQPSAPKFKDNDMPTAEEIWNKRIL